MPTRPIKLFISHASEDKEPFINGLLTLPAQDLDSTFGTTNTLFGLAIAVHKGSDLYVKCPINQIADPTPRRLG
jgi:hypothetical protein